MRTERHLLLYLAALLVMVWFSTSVSAAEITLEVWNSDANLQAMEWYEKVLVPAFEKTHPGVKVEVVKTPWGQALTDKTVTMYASGMGPDIIYGGAEFIDGYVENNFVIPLDEKIKVWGQLRDFIPPSLGAVTYNGRVYGLPMQLDIRAMAINKQVFMQNGQDPNAPPKTWDEFASVAKRLTRRTGDNKVEVSGGNVDRLNYQAFNVMVWQNGASILNESKNAAAFNSEKGIYALDFWSSLMKEISYGTGVNALQRGKTHFLNGKVAMLYEATPRNIADTIIAAGQVVEEIMVVVPPVRQEKPVMAIFPNWMGIGSQSKHPDLAWEFLKFHHSAENYAAFVEVNNTFPTRLSTIQSNYMMKTPWLKQTTMLAAQYGQTAWTSTYFRELNNALGPWLTKAFLGETSAKSALDSAANAWATILGNNK